MEQSIKLEAFAVSHSLLKTPLWQLMKELTHSFLDNEHLGAIVYYRTAHSELS